MHDPKIAREGRPVTLNLEDTPDVGIRRSLKPEALPRAALDYLSPRSRVAYFFDSVDSSGYSGGRCGDIPRASPSGTPRRPRHCLMGCRSPPGWSMAKAAWSRRSIGPPCACWACARIRSSVCAAGPVHHAGGRGLLAQRGARPRGAPALRHRAAPRRRTAALGQSQRQPVALPDGERFWLVLLHDQTRRRRAEAEREGLLAELRATLESTADGILVTDLSGRVRSFNRRFVQIWELPGGHLHEPGDAGLWLSLQRLLSDGDLYRRRIDALLSEPLTRSTDTFAPGRWPRAGAGRRCRRSDGVRPSAACSLPGSEREDRRAPTHRRDGAGRCPHRAPNRRPLCDLMARQIERKGQPSPCFTSTWTASSRSTTPLAPAMA